MDRTVRQVNRYLSQGEEHPPRHSDLDALESRLRSGEVTDEPSEGENETSSPSDDPHSYLEHPIADGYVSASGSGGGVQYESGQTFRTPLTVHHAITGGRTIPSDRAWWTRVRGTSMEPWLQNGSFIFCEVVERATTPGRYVVHLDDDDAEIVKRIEVLGGGGLILISDNNAHPRRQLRQVEDSDDPNLYYDETYGVTLRLSVRGFVLYPEDTGQSIVSLVSQTLRDLR